MIKEVLFVFVKLHNCPFRVKKIASRRQTLLVTETSPCATDMRWPSMVLVWMSRSLMLVAVIHCCRSWFEKRSLAEGRFLSSETKTSPSSMGRTLENSVAQMT